MSPLIPPLIPLIPNLNDVLKQYGPMLSGFANMAAPLRQQAKVAAQREARAVSAEREAQARAARKAIESEIKSKREYD